MNLEHLMGKDSIRHLIFMRNRWRYKPSHLMVPHGFKFLTLGPGMVVGNRNIASPEDQQRAIELYAEWDRIRLGLAEPVKSKYPAGSVGEAYLRVIRLRNADRAKAGKEQDRDRRPVTIGRGLGAGSNPISGSPTQDPSNPRTDGSFLFRRDRWRARAMALDRVGWPRGASRGSCAWNGFVAGQTRQGRQPGRGLVIRHLSHAFPIVMIGAMTCQVLLPQMNWVWFGLFPVFVLIVTLAAAALLYRVVEWPFMDLASQAGAHQNRPQGPHAGEALISATRPNMVRDHI
ncbi:hypothetical protein GGC47_004470 [Bosea sp. OAE752]|uniref:hypothetical protein n=1 Tax=Bosea sp. OAE752 TaxID=2663873 RepID=UPI003D1D3347